jgi:heat shock protein HslJ
MKTNYALLLICLCVGGVNSCKTENTFNVEDLNGKWTIIAVKEDPIQLENMPFLVFDVAEKNVHGNTSCNTLTSKFESDANDKTAIRFLRPVSTMMACINGMDTEAKILQVITDITHVKKGETPDRIRLVDKTGNTMLLLEKQ